MIILISGSVGCGKTTIAQKLALKTGYNLFFLNEIAKKFVIGYDNDVNTYDFDIDLLVEYVEQEIIPLSKNVILEGHFSHFIDSLKVDVLFVIGRDSKLLKEEYVKRGYNQKKISENLQVENFNLSFFEAIENGFVDKKNLFYVDNNQNIEKTVEEILKLIYLNVKKSK